MILAHADPDLNIKTAVEKTVKLLEGADGYINRDQTGYRGLAGFIQ